MVNNNKLMEKNTNNPCVSILIPLYNAEKFLLETLNSCINQTYTNIEVIVVDDGSKDNSYTIALEYTKKYPQVKLYKQSNFGACRARNYAFKQSKGDYIMYLDADDIINPEFVTAHIARLEQTKGYDITFCPWDRFYNSIEEAKFPHLSIYKDYNNAFQLLLDMWVSGNMLQTSSYMISRQLVIESGGWDETILKNQDGEFFSRILMTAKRALFVPRGKVFYRTGDYLTVSKASSEQKVASMLDTFISYRKNALIYEDSKRVREALSINFTLFIYLYGNLYPNLYTCAKEEIENLSVGYILRNEPCRVKLICKFIGFDNFMILRKLILNR